MSFGPTTAPASAWSAGCPHGPYSNYHQELGEVYNIAPSVMVLDAGTPFCAAGPDNRTTGLLFSDGVTPLGVYLERAGVAGPVQWFSTYVKAPARELPATDTL